MDRSLLTLPKLNDLPKTQSPNTISWGRGGVGDGLHRMNWGGRGCTQSSAEQVLSPVFERSISLCLCLCLCLCVSLFPLSLCLHFLAAGSELGSPDETLSGSCLYCFLSTLHSHCIHIDFVCPFLSSFNSIKTSKFSCSLLWEVFSVAEI